jgi:hypothetical protein
MRGIFLSTAILACVLISDSATAQADPSTFSGERGGAKSTFEMRRQTTEAGYGAGQELEHLPLLSFPKLTRHH